MAVYKRTYKGYEGRLTEQWSRFMILPRYSYARLFQSKFLLMFLAVCAIYPIGAAGFIYIAHNLSFLQALNVPAGNFLQVNEKFFVYYCNFQSTMAYLLTAIVGPTLVSPDLTNNAMPLYLCRRWEGTPTALEHTALKWVRPKDLASWPMPAADLPLIPMLRDLL